MMGLDLPPPPLFQDVMEKNIIPQARRCCVSQHDRSARSFNCFHAMLHSEI